ncbi:FixH family protein [Comamonas sp. NoAH]|uniref:FixH family protein n=1 Tax=Comamonas halotolerans TaxID=3041496 RepID=UPI0024E14C63|nr:FixH family protein [Comamonas sp. NoAH]
MTQIAKKQETPSGPWWKYGHMWLVLGGPAVVVVAGIVTAMIATNGADPVVDENYYQKGLNINQELRKSEKSLAPANAARNHAATPDADLPDLTPK